MGGVDIASRATVEQRHALKPPRTTSRLTFPTVLLLLVAGGLLSCESNPVEVAPVDGVVDLARAWNVVEPDLVGLDAAALDRAASTLESEPRAMSLLVVRSGRLAYERYFRGNNADSLNDVRSVTKSVVSTLVGIALHEGFIDNLQLTLGELLPASYGLTPAQSAIQLQHLLTMSGGFEWTESGSTGYNEWITSPDHIAFLLTDLWSTPQGRRSRTTPRLCTCLALSSRRRRVSGCPTSPTGFCSDPSAFASPAGKACSPVSTTPARGSICGRETWRVSVSSRSREA